MGISFLKKRRKDSRLILLYKGLKGKARIPTDDSFNHSNAYATLVGECAHALQCNKIILDIF